MTLPLPDEMSDPWVYLQNNPEPPTNSWVVHGLECDDGQKLPPTELVRLVDLEEERKSSIALMKLLADEKHKSEALAAELVRCRAANVYDGAAHRNVGQLTAALEMIRDDRIPQGMPPSMFADRVLASQTETFAEAHGQPLLPETKGESG